MTTPLLHINPNVNKVTRSGSLFTWSGGGKSYVSDRRGIFNDVCVVVEKINGVDHMQAYKIKMWSTTPVDDVNAHSIEIGDPVGRPIIATIWTTAILNGRLDHRRWPFNKFNVNNAMVKHCRIIPYHRFEDQLFLITGDRDVIRCAVAFRFSPCRITILAELPDEFDEFSSYAEVEDIRVFADQVDHNFSDKYRHSDDAYDIIEERLEALFQSGTGLKPRPHKTEQKTIEALTKKYDIEIEKSFPWCRGQRARRFDIYIPKHKTLIEVDGNQHFEDVPYFRSEVATVQQNDHYKTTCARTNGYSVIRISQEDIWHDRIAWRDEIDNAIANLDRATPRVYYIARDPHLYDNHRLLIQ